MGLDSEIKKLLLQEHSKSHIETILQWIKNDPVRMDAFMRCFFSDSKILCQRASWPIMYISERNPKLLYPYLEQMVEGLEDVKHDAVRRNTLRVFIIIPIPESIEGQLLEYCFQFINDPRQAGGIRAFSIKVAAIIIQKYPELKEELIISLQDHLPSAGKAFKSAARQVLKKLNKMN